MTDPLHQAVRTAQARLAERLELASAAMAEHISTREIIARTDAFLVNTCRHAAAMCDQVLPAARAHMPQGDARVQAYLEQCRRMERAVMRAKQRMYGEAHAVSASWTQVWAAVIDEVRALHALEDDLVEDLGRAEGAPDRARIARHLHAVSMAAPTRPHPRSPHLGRIAHVTRRFWARADQFWDNAEGRTVVDRPAPAEAAGDREDLAS
ncbi:hypothetical protein HMPREF0063_12159 [Aeromicrobium marinum DSM 15272]|uniref:Hemerythrin-like domain-containing protein n=1 Tax=Aeromicrobium marinum DSM 15272 TaxID=585531 RepID=E2SCJ7_9ACTN|nr:hypothetical protein [Aeromicrobium marinum]EFQ82950.1 hypothetical protein HMPREF0063_12159 [Aeromicrobium marinum DSM 15272]